MMRTPLHRIPEISLADFIACIAPVYAVLEGRHTSKTTTDPFTKTILASRNGMTTEQWDAAEVTRLKEKALSMKMGDFHEELMGKFKGYQTFPNGHATGCDVGSESKKRVLEIKNRDNTMNSGSAETVVKKLMAVHASGYQAILVMVNSAKKTLPRFGAPKEIEVWDGRKAYAELSGRAGFFDDLLLTLGDVFRLYPTFESLKRGTV